MLGQTDTGELFGGYSFERIAPGCGSNYRCGSETAGPTTNLNGWTASLTGYFYKSFGISAEFSGNYNGTAALSSATVNRYTYQFGPAYALRMRRSTPFVHALFGGVSQTSIDDGLNYHAFLWSVGGGLDFKASKRVSIRLAQLDYERQHVPVVDTGGPTPIPSVGANGLRYSAGIVFKF
jgi:hypothetical protein